MTPDESAGRILLIEDDEVMARQMADYLVRCGFEVDRSRDAAQACRAAQDGRYDAVVLDAALPRLEGLELLRASSTPLLALTGRDAVYGLESDDRLGKPFALQELEARLRSLVQRTRRRRRAGVLQVADLVLDLAEMRATRAGQALALSPTDARLLAVLMRESPRAVGRAELEGEVWGHALPDSGALRSHLYHLRKAIDRPFEHALLQTVQGVGYRLAAPA